MQKPAGVFAVRSFRFQWPADLATSWAFEMETLILGWYILIETGSVEGLVLFGALIWIGSLFSPFFGLAGDRVGMRALLAGMRAAYALVAAALAILALAGVLAPWHVFVAATIAGIVRPSDMVMRNVLVAQTMRPDLLMSALGISRATADTARIAGALAGTGTVALLGLGPAYVLVTVLYVAAFFLTLGVARPAARPASSAAPGSRSRGGSARAVVADLRQGIRYVWQTPDQLGAFGIAFLANLLAFPFFLGLLPYVAREVYGTGQAGLGYLAASFAAGALAGSLFLGARRVPLAAGRAMLLNAGIWFLAVMLLGQTQSLVAGLLLLFACGCVQSLSLTPLAAVMLRSASDDMRGRVMGMRSLAVWGLPLGLLAAGPLIARLGFPATTLLYGGIGLAATCAIGWRWRHALWRRSAPANAAA